jgi:hypothetical protein
MCPSYIAHECEDVRPDCLNKVGAACGFLKWKPMERPGPFCKNYQRFVEVKVWNMKWEILKFKNEKEGKA